MIRIMKSSMLFVFVIATNILHAQTTAQFTSGADNSWLGASNWTTGSVPGASAIAVFNTQPSGSGSNNGCNINFGDVSTNNGVNGQIIGAVRVLSTRTGEMNIGNSSPSIDGTLTLQGLTINGLANVVVDNLMSAANLNFNNSIVGNNRIMRLAFGANAIFLGASNSITQITTQVVSATNVTVNGGQLQLNRSGGTTFPVGTNLTVSSGSLRISTNQTINNLELAAGTALYIDANTTLTITGSFVHKGASIIRAGSGQLAYGSTATLDYNGNASQSISVDEWPLTGGPRNVTVSNSSGVIITANRTLTGSLTISGSLTLGAFQLSANTVAANAGATIKTASANTSGALTGSFGASAVVTLNSGSTVEFNGTTVQYADARTYPNLSVNNGSNGLLLAGNATINGTLTLNTATKLDLAGRTLTLAGSVAGSGNLKGSSASVLNIAGAGAVGTLNFDQTTDGASNALSTLAVSSGSAVLGSKLNVYIALNVAGGTFDLAAKNLVLKSNQTQTAYVAEIKGTLSGETNVTVERYNPAWSTRRWRLITSPVMNTTINAAWQEGGKWNGSSTQPSTNFGTLITGQAQGSSSTANNNGFDFWTSIAAGSASIRAYVPATTSSQASWQPVSSTLAPNAFNNHQAYLLFIRGDRSVYTGAAAGTTTLRANGTLKKGSFTITVPVTQSHTLIGNPYAAPLDFKQIYDANSTKILPSFWVWQSSLGTGTGGYVLMQPVASGSSLYESIPGNGSQTAANRLIHSGEGFFVIPNPSATGTNAITIQEAYKSTTTPGLAVFRQQNTAPAKLYVNVATEVGGANTLLDGALAQYSATGDELNMVKASNSTENLSIVRNSSDLIVASAAMPQSGDSLQLRLWNTTNKSYQMEIRSTNFEGSGLIAVLVDRYLKTETVLNLNSAVTTYSFNVTADAASRDQKRFVVAFKAGVTLPLSISSIKAEQKNSNQVSVQWKVADESGIKAYTVERSVEGTSFAALHTAAAKAGAGEQAYTFLDGQPSTLNYYRIKMLGTGGVVKYSSVVKVQLNKEEDAVILYPNPVSAGAFTVQLMNKPKGLYHLTLYNMAGQAVLSKSMQHAGYTTAELFTLNDSITPGSYKLEVSDAAGKKEVSDVSVIK
jgi:hypothetical protein